MATVSSLTFGTLLKRYRLAAGLTQEELADRAVAVYTRSSATWALVTEHSKSVSR